MLDKCDYIVVGSASACNPVGDMVDCHERVLRFNTFYLPPFVHLVGSKTTDWMLRGKHWSLNQNYNLASYRRRSKQCAEEKGHNWFLEGKDEVTRVLVNYHLRYKAASRPRMGALFQFHEHFPKMSREETYVIAESAPDDDVEPGDAHRILRFSELLGDLWCLYRGGTAPSLGILGIAAVVEHFGIRPVPIAGFGRRDKMAYGYFYDKKQPDQSHLHDFDAERVVLNKWEEKGLIRRCDQ